MQILDVHTTQNFIVKFNNLIVRGGGGHDPYIGPYSVTSSFNTQTLLTNDKYMTSNVTVDGIEVTRISNPEGGVTLKIGS